MRCTSIELVARRLALFVSVGLVAGALAGCASGPFARSGPSREDAIALCIEKTPAETVPFGDRFASCMEEQGWVYTGPGD